MHGGNVCTHVSNQTPQIVLKPRHDNVRVSRCKGLRLLLIHGVTFPEGFTPPLPGTFPGVFLGTNLITLPVSNLVRLNEPM